MRFLRRKQLNQIQPTGGGVDVDELDSPGATTVVTAKTDEQTDAGAGTNPPVNPPSAPPVGDVVNNNSSSPSSSEPKTDENQLEKKEGDEQRTEDDEDDVFALAVEQLGYQIDVNALPEGVAGLVEFTRQAAQLEREAAIQQEYDELRRDAAPAVELAQWMKSGRSERDFYLSKMESPRIEPTTLTEAPVTVLQDIIYKNFIKQGLTEDMANILVKNAVDSNSAVNLAQQIVEADNKKSDEAKAAQEAADAAKRNNDYKAFVDDIKAREEHIKKGQLRGITVPVTEQQAFIDANFYDAGNPEFPGMSAVDIAMVQMTKEDIDLYRFLVWKKLDVNSLVQARAKTANVNAAILNRKSGGSRMSGGVSRTGDNDDRSLDSPNA